MGTIYKIRIDKTNYDVHVPKMTGAEVLALAGKPPAQFGLIQRLHGGQAKPIGNDEIVCFTDPGVEHFVTLPRDQTEGRGSRRAFDLPGEDVEYLNATGLNWETIVEGPVRWLLIHDRPIAAGYQVSTALTALQIVPQYPDGALDMVRFFPALTRSDGRPIKAVSGLLIDGRPFQQWSRHRTAQNPWRPGIDDVASQLFLVEDWLAREFSR